MTALGGFNKAAFSLSLVGLLLLVLLPAFTSHPAFTGLGFTLIFMGFSCDSFAALKGSAPSASQSPLLWGLLVLLFSFSFFSPVTWQGIEREFVWMACLMGGLTLKNQIKTSAQQQIVCRCTIGLLIVLCLRGLAESLYLFEALRSQAQSLGLTAPDQLTGFFTSNRARATFGQANGFAGFLLVFLPMTLLLAIEKPKLGGPILVLLLSAFWVTGSKGGALVALGIGGLTLRKRGMSPQRRILSTTLLALAAVGTLICLTALLSDKSPAYFPQRLDQSLETLRLRRSYWSCAWSMLTDEWPWGVGAGLFGENYFLHAPPDAPFSRFAHNGFLQMLAEYGAGALLLAGLLVWRWRSSWRQETLMEISAASMSRPPFELGLAFLIAAPAFSLSLWPKGGGLLGLCLLLVIAFLVDFFLVRQLALSLPRLTHRHGHIIQLSLLAFLLHSLVDFDLHITPLTAALALALSLKGAENRTLPLRKKSATMGILLAVGLSVFWLAGPGASQQQRAAAQPSVSLGSWPVDLRLLYRATDQADMDRKTRRVLLDIYESLESEFGDLPSFAARSRMLREK